ncbi:MAG: NrfD/PsrC family molybdoenzyme membrane anchor subunit, partial [Pirellulaceae bacterium]
FHSCSQLATSLLVQQDRLDRHSSGKHKGQLPATQRAREWTGDDAASVVGGRGMKKYLTFLWDCFRLSFVGDWRFNFPLSMLSWDVIALNGYLLLNLHICGYLIYCAYCGRQPSPLFYVPFVFVAIVWAISIHTVTAFLYVGLGGRPFWNSAIIAPRFLASAFAAGPAFIILTLQVVRKFTRHQVRDEVLLTLRQIVQVAMIINSFLLACEVFTEFYTDSAHVASARYLYFGLHGHEALVPWIWSAIGMNLLAATLLMLPASRALNTLNLACVLSIVGIWIEKGMGLIVPAFVPTPLGEIVEYTPTPHEILVCLGIWAFGLLIYIIFVRVSVPVLAGDVTYEKRFGQPAK